MITSVVYPGTIRLWSTAALLLCVALPANRLLADDGGSFVIMVGDRVVHTTDPEEWSIIEQAQFASQAPNITGLGSAGGQSGGGQTGGGQTGSGQAGQTGSGQGASPFAGFSQGGQNTGVNTSAFGGQASAASSNIPQVIGDFFDGGGRVVSITNVMETSFFACGERIGTTPGGVPLFAFERDGIGTKDDVFTNGMPGSDGSGDGIDDTYAILEPVPPNEVPTSPGPEYVFDGGTAVYTDSTMSTDPANGVPADGESWFISYSFSRTRDDIITAGGGGVAVRRFKIAENNSPMPRDRVFFNYSFFNDVQANFGDISRYVLGFEKTFGRKVGSLEMRLPFAATLDSQQVADGVIARGFQFGDLLLIWKLLLWHDRQFAIAVGNGVAVPTASGTGLYFEDGRQLLDIRNDAVHYLPYFAGSWAPNSRFFTESFVQFDFDGKGDRVFGSSVGGSTLPQIGRLNDSSILFVDTAFGFWLRNDPCRRVLTGVAPVAEFHYATTITNADVVSGNGLVITDISPRIDVLNLTLGTHFRFRRGLNVTAGMTVPLRQGDDEPFDYEALAQVNWIF